MFVYVCRDCTCISLNLYISILSTELLYDIVSVISNYDTNWHVFQIPPVSTSWTSLYQHYTRRLHIASLIQESASSCSLFLLRTPPTKTQAQVHAGRHESLLCCIFFVCSFAYTISYIGICTNQHIHYIS